MYEILCSILTPDDSVKIEVGQAIYKSYQRNLTNQASSCALNLIRTNEFFRHNVTSLACLRDTIQGHTQVQRS